MKSAPKFTCPDGVSVVWSPVNHAYFILFGSGGEKPAS